MRAAIACLIVLLNACSTLDEKKRSATLEDATLGYATAVRWGDFERADSFRQLADPAAPVPAPDTLAQIRITSYQAQATRISPAIDSAEVDVAITFYVDDTMKLQTVHDHQHWVYDRQAGAWVITTPLPDFRNAR